jgi:hypothetical protein
MIATDILGDLIDLAKVLMIEKVHQVSLDRFTESRNPIVICSGVHPLKIIKNGWR